MGRNFIGIESDAANYAIALRRVTAAAWAPRPMIADMHTEEQAWIT
jgi:DNA modification methylase